MSGIRLEANCHIITGLVAAANNIKRCAEKAGLQVQDLILEPLASSEAVLTEEEKEAGVVLVVTENKDELTKICVAKNYTLLPIAGESRGVHVS